MDMKLVLGIEDGDLALLLGGLLSGGSGAATGNTSPTEGEAM